MPALADHRSETRDLLTRRLSTEFVIFSAEDVARCVADVQARMTHLGLSPTLDLVERMAREQLTSRVKSDPPSGSVTPWARGG
ncbi:hypothetical protein [Actinomadura rupiterrae]|uniref:hypothetical protein n=1 Tax=Actinomadura rupiterrae TaxID=559627 RepID=UPI0020A42740|nr:hypothetical protein [Actinomadura rupiterrae]MCP2335613.1 hypothetical protein [Actinomadura rupiterrae]